MPTSEEHRTMPLEFETRFIPLRNVSATAVIPYVRDALRTLGFGSVIPVGEKGIQLTIPVGLMHNLQSVIQEYDKPGMSLSSFDVVVYRDVIPITKRAAVEAIRQSINELGLCPPDLKFLVLARDQTTGRFVDLVFYGPASREKFYKDEVIDRVKALANQLSV